ncbi:MAG: tetratricopeptide repeat protein, partial [Acidobacteriota bacterium]
DPRSDVFSLGVILYELATGRRPFLGATGAELAAAILKEEPTPITALVQQLPRPLWHVVRRCLQKQPERRFQHGFELKSELEQFPRESPDVASEPAASIAILPFTDTSREKDQDYFCEGIAEEIINALTKISGLEVAPKTSSFSFQGSSLDSREIGRRLGVSTLLGGSVRKAGDRLRIIVELIDAERSAYLWTERYDREMQDIFAIQEEIARSVADAFSVTLSSDERGSLCCVSTSDVHAYDFYLRGRKFYYQYRRQGIEFALQMFSKAIERDPGFASAYAGIADCHAYLYVNADRDEAHSRKADEASLRALELDPSSAQAHASRGVALSINGRCDEAEHAFEAAIRLDEQLFEAFYFYARMCFSQGKLQRAAQLYDRAAKLRADDYQALLLMAQVYDDLGEPENATSARRRGVRVAEARLELNPDDSRAWYMGANGLVALGDRERGLEWAARALALEPGEPMLLYNVACIRSMAGETEAAIDALEQAFARGFTYKEWVDHDSNLDAVRDHPRFKNLMASLS